MGKKTIIDFMKMKQNKDKVTWITSYDFLINLLGLIQMYNTYDHNNIYHDVATCILKNYTRLDKMTSVKIAELCNISPSTLHRFFKMMSFPMTVSKFPYLVSSTKENYIFDGNYIPESLADDKHTSIDTYLTNLIERIQALKESIDQIQVQSLIDDIRSCTKVVFIGCPIPQGIWRFQIDLTLNGIESSAFMNPNYQYEELDHLEEGTIVFYAQYYRLGDNKHKKGILESKKRIKKLVVLTNNKAHPLASLADYLFLYKGNGTEQDAIMMNIYINIIAMTFREKEIVLL